MKKMKYNTIPKQVKTATSRIAPQEWNYIINVLKEQVNYNSSILEDVPLLRKDLEKLTTVEMIKLKADILILFKEHFKDKSNPHNVKADQVEYVPNENVKEAIDRSAKVDEENAFTKRQEFIRGIYTGPILMEADSKIEGLGDGIDSQDAVNKSQLDKKVDKITEEQRDSFGIMDPEERIVYGTDRNLNEMPIKASPFKEKNTIVMRDDDGFFQDLYDHDRNPGAHSDEFNKKVDKAQTIIGLDLQDNILLGEFKEALGEATRDLSGLMSADDKKKLDTLRDLLGPEGGDSDAVVNTIREVLDIFQNYPEGVKVIETLEGKQDKLVAGNNITIDENNVISFDGGVDAGEFGEAFTGELDAGEFV